MLNEIKKICLAQQNRFFAVKTTTRLKWPYKLVLFIVIIAIILIFHQTIFLQAGSYLEMSGNLSKPVDLIVVEGGFTVSHAKINEAIRLWRQGLGKQILVVLHSLTQSFSPVGLDNYVNHVAAYLDSAGLDKELYTIIQPKLVHPYTLNEAKAVAHYLKDEEVKSLVILTDSFHMRRTFLAYQKILKPSHIMVIPHSVKGDLDSTNWWQYADGFRFVLGEYVKLVYYLFTGNV